MSQSPLVFVHVPKTAGTSFRIGAEQWFGADKICKDYGLQSGETSPAVRLWMLERNDPWYFKKAFTAEGYCFLSGHIQASRYSQIFGMDRMTTFLRDPIQRVISEYKHWVRHHDYKEKFETFRRSKAFVNKQLKCFHGVPWPAIGFIGITEQYDLSLRLFNEKFATHIPRLEENIGKSNLGETHELSLEQEQELKTLNANEIVFYNQARQQLIWRGKISDSAQVFSRGLVSKLNGQQLSGWAVYDRGDDPVRLHININGEKVGETVACENRPHLHLLGVRRGGFVGFSLDIPPVTAEDEISVSVAETGQPLANSPWHPFDQQVNPEQL